MLKFKTSCAVLAYLSFNLLNEVGLSLFRYFEVGLRVCDIVVKKFTFAISSPDEFLFLLFLSLWRWSAWRLATVTCGCNKLSAWLVSRCHVWKDDRSWRHLEASAGKWTARSRADATFPLLLSRSSEIHLRRGRRSSSSSRSLSFSASLASSDDTHFPLRLTVACVARLYVRRRVIYCIIDSILNRRTLVWIVCITTEPGSGLCAAV